MTTPAQPTPDEVDSELESLIPWASNQEVNKQLEKLARKLLKERDSFKERLKAQNKLNDLAISNQERWMRNYDDQKLRADNLELALADSKAAERAAQKGARTNAMINVKLVEQLARYKAVCEQYHQAWTAYKVFPSLANEGLFAEAGTNYQNLTKE